MEKDKTIVTEIVNCDLCGQDNFKPLFLESGYTFGQCRNCSLYYICSRPNEKRQDKIIRDSSLKESQASLKEKFYEMSLYRKQECIDYLNKIEKIIKRGRSLDVGCGIGTLMWYASKRKWQVEGIEVNKEKLKIARCMNIGKIYSRPVEELNLIKETYDVITMVNVFSHFRSPKKTLRLLMSLVKPNGLLLMRTGEFRNNPTKNDLPSWGLGAPHHLVWNSEKTIDLYGKEIGANIIYYQSIPFNEYFVRNKFLYKSENNFKQFVKLVLRNTPGFIDLIIRIDNWRKRYNPIYDATVIYQKTV